MWTVQTGTVQSFSSSHRESLVWTGLYISVPCFCVLVVFDFWKESASVLPVQRHFNSKCKDSSPVDSNRSCSGRIYCSIWLANVRIKSWFLLGSLILGGSVLTASCWRCLILDLTTRLFLCVAARCFFHVVIQRQKTLRTFVATSLCFICWAKLSLSHTYCRLSLMSVGGI